MIIGKNIRNKYLLSLGLIFLLETISYLGYLNGAVNVFAFLAISIIFIFLCIYRFRTALMISLVELIIGSKGYLFYLDLGNFKLSIRITFWVILMLFWVISLIRRLIKDKKEVLVQLKFFVTYKTYVFLAASVVLAVGMALVKHNSFANLFFDFNAWIYFLTLLPWLDLFSQSKNRNNIWSKVALFAVVATSWLAIKSLVMLFIFTHFPFESVFSLYRWIRTTGIGEVTLMPSGFYRVFFQSQVYLIFAWFFAFFSFHFAKEKKVRMISIIALLISSTVIILSFSRSYWVGMLGGGLVAILLLFKYTNWKKSLISLLLVSFISFLSFSLVMGIAKFPYPKPTKDFSASSLAERTEINTNEAALASRWALLPELWNKVKEEPILGSGFGATVTYKASDPRILEINSEGVYTTYAFEWSWLDLWLKLGLLGVLSYLFLLFAIIKANLKLHNIIGYSFASALVALMVLNIFTPYLNHPLGMMFIILASLYPMFLGKEKANP